MNPRILSAQRERYRTQFEKQGDSPQATFQNDPQTRSLRFERLLKPLFPSFSGCFSIHDVGSGLCDLHEYLLDRGVNHEYSGTEIVPEMIAHSKQKFPGIALYERDLVNNPSSEKYDFVVLSGTLNLLCGLDRKGWEKYAHLLLIRMFEMAQRAISFNFLTTYNTFTAPELCYFDPKALFDFCQKKLSRFVWLDHAYPLYEATIAVFQPPELKSGYPDAAFRKYFQ